MVFAVLHSIVNLFPQIMALSISSISLQACCCKSFPVNDDFPLQTRNFLPQMFYHIRYLLDFITTTKYLQCTCHLY